MTDHTDDPAAKDDLARWLQASDAAFDIVIGEAHRFPEANTIHVDRAFLEKASIEAFPERLGALPVAAVDQRLQKIALRWSKKLAHAEAEQLGLTAHGLARAWMLPIFAELTTLCPLRHLARKLHADHPGALFVVEISQSRFACLKFWRPSEVEPFFLALELRRRGAMVCLRVEKLETPYLTFDLSQMWRRKWHSQVRRDPGFTTVLSEKHMRRDDFVAAQAGATRRLRPGPLALMGAVRAGRASVRLDLRKGPAFEGLQAYRAPANVPSLAEVFVRLIVPPTRFLHGWVQRMLRNRPVKAAHIADHASLDGGVLADEVARRGGKLHLWPHSANAVDVSVHEPSEVARVTVAARSTAAEWAARFGWEKVSIDPRTILPDTPRAPGFDPSRPIHVILFGGAHGLHRMPMVALEEHKQTWHRVLSGLRASGVELTIKHKSGWETRDWISARAPEGMALSFSRTHATKLAEPNMVFMSISLASTALLEGIARGVPGIIVRDQPVRETPHYDPDYVPCISSDAVEGTLKALGNRDAWEALRDRQLEWFARETS